MTKQSSVILSGVLLFLVVFLSGYLILNPKENKDEIKKEVELIVKNEQLAEEVEIEKLKADSLLNITVYQDSIIKKKINKLPLIKPKYDKKVQAITTSPADSISRFIINRHNI